MSATTTDAIFHQQTREVMNWPPVVVCIQNLCCGSLRLHCSFLFLLASQLTFANDLFAKYEEFLDYNRVEATVRCQLFEKKYYEYQSRSFLWNDPNKAIVIDVDFYTICLKSISFFELQRKEKYRHLVKIDQIQIYPDVNFYQNSNQNLGRNWEERNIIENLSRNVNQIFANRKFDKASIPWKSLIKFTTPFLFEQNADGRILEVLFAPNDTDTSVHNFKNHIADIFRTYLDPSAEPVEESSSLGHHQSRYSLRKVEDNGTVVERVVTPKDVFYDTKTGDPPAIRSFQQTKYNRDGYLIYSSGVCNIRMYPEDKLEGEGAEEKVIDLSEHLQVSTQFITREVPEKPRHTREANEINPDLFNYNWTKASPKAASDPYDPGMVHLLLHDINKLVSELKEAEPYKDNVVNAIIQLALLEDKEDRKVASSLLNSTFDLKTIRYICHDSFDQLRCQDVLLVLSRSGSADIEQKLLSLLNGNDPKQLQILAADMISELPQPSELLIQEVLGLMVSSRSSAIRNHLWNSAAIAATRSNVAARLHHRVVNTLIEELDKFLHIYEDNADLLDLLIAFGNLKNQQTVNRLLILAKRCSWSDPMHLGILSALTPFAHTTPDVQDWIIDVLKKGSCWLQETALGVLSDRALLSSSRPLDKLDHFLLDLYNSSQCEFRGQIERYRRKRQVVPDVSGLQGYLPCEKWAPDDDPDLAKLTKKRSCWKLWHLGVSQLNTEISTGYLYGVEHPSEKEHYLITNHNLVVLNFFSRQVEVGSLYYGNLNGETFLVVSIFGVMKPRISRKMCEPIQVSYPTVLNIPIFSRSFVFFDLSIGIQVGGRITYNSSCKLTRNKETVFQIMPLFKLHVMPGVVVKYPLMIIAGIDLLMEITFFNEGLFQPYPDMCVNGNFGFEPAKIGLLTWIEVENGDVIGRPERRIIDPLSPVWEIGPGLTLPWILEMCMLRDNSTEETFLIDSSTNRFNPPNDYTQSIVKSFFRFPVRSARKDSV